MEETQNPAHAEDTEVSENAISQTELSDDEDKEVENNVELSNQENSPAQHRYPKEDEMSSKSENKTKSIIFPDDSVEGDSSVTHVSEDERNTQLMKSVHGKGLATSFNFTLNETVISS
jgi:hypothetical protein